MIHNLNNFVNESSGSSLTFSAHGWWGKEKKKSAEKIGRPRKNTAEGGCGGNSAVFLQKIEAKPAALLVQSRTQQKSFLFLLEEKIRRVQIRKAEKTFLLGGERSERRRTGFLGLVSFSSF